MISELERRFIVEQIEQALVEIDGLDTCEFAVQTKIVDGLVEALKILGVEYERN